MKLAYNKMPPLVTLILFAFIIWPYLGTRVPLHNAAPPLADTSVPDFSRMATSRKTPHRDPFLRAVADSYAELTRRDKMYAVRGTQISTTLDTDETSMDNETKAALLQSMPPLTGTVVAGDYCCAYIGGLQYELGETLNAGTGSVYRIKQITKGHVTLESVKTGKTLDLVPELEQRTQSAISDGGRTP